MNSLFPIAAGPLGSLLGLIAPNAPIVVALTGVWARKAAMVSRLIDVYSNGLFTYTTTITQDDADDPTEATVISAPNVMTNCYAQGYSDQEVNNDTIHAGDRMVVMKGAALGRPPKKGEEITLDTITHTVEQVAQWPAAGLVCFYVMQVRTAAKGA